MAPPAPKRRYTKTGIDRSDLTQYQREWRRRRRAEQRAERVPATWRSPRQCEGCGIEIEPVVPQQRYCTEKCRLSVRRRVAAREYRNAKSTGIAAAAGRV